MAAETETRARSHACGRRNLVACLWKSCMEWHPSVERMNQAIQTWYNRWQTVTPPIGKEEHMSFSVNVLLPDDYIYAITTSRKEVGGVIAMYSDGGEESWERPIIRRNVNGSDLSIVRFLSTDSYGYRRFVDDEAFPEALSPVSDPFVAEVACWDYSGYVTKDDVSQSPVRDIYDRPIAPWESVLFHALESASYDDEDGEEVFLAAWDEVVEAIDAGHEVYIKPGDTPDDRLPRTLG